MSHSLFRASAPLLLLLLALGSASGCGGRPASPGTPSTAADTADIGRAASGATTQRGVADSSLEESTVRRPTIDRAIADGVTFLVKDQNPDGSWGTGLETRGTEIYSSVPGSHDAFRVATTALCVMALREVIDARPDLPSAVEAHRRGVKYLVEHGEARRDDGSIIYNVWAHTFALQALAGELRVAKDERESLASAVRDQLDRMVRYETVTGGWNYYDFGSRTQTPSMASTSFGTAAGLVSLWESKRAGIEPPPKLVDRAMRRVLDSRLPNGAYLYGDGYKYIPRTPANMLRGSIGRAQPCNFALWLWNSPAVGEAQSIDGLESFFREHVYLDMARKRPYPHEAWYQNSGYYYYYDHYYAGRLLDRLKPEDRARFAPQLAEHILPHQEADGSWWDYAMWDYHKPYGTAFAIMTLLRAK